VAVLEHPDVASQEIIYELSRRLIVYRLGEFERVWEAANRICDRYQASAASAGCARDSRRDASATSRRDVGGRSRLPVLSPA
jgi:hypothetical protein